MDAHKDEDNVWGLKHGNGSCKSVNESCQVGRVDYEGKDDCGEPCGDAALHNQWRKSRDHHIPFSGNYQFCLFVITDACISQLIDRV